VIAEIRRRAKQSGSGRTSSTQHWASATRQQARPLGGREAQRRATPRSEGNIPGAPKKQTGADLLPRLRGRQNRRRNGWEPAWAATRMCTTARHLRRGKRLYAGYRTEADERLLHELVHAVRCNAGSRCLCRWWQPGNGQLRGTGAILVSNIYRSERKRKDLRKDHRGHLPLGDKTKDPAVFANVYFNYLLSFKVEQEILFEELRRAGAPWNPVRPGRVRLGPSFVIAPLHPDSNKGIACSSR